MQNYISKIFVGLVAVIFTSVALACPPPNYPPNWKPHTYEETIHALYEEAQDVVVVEVVKVEKKSNPGEATPNGRIEKAYVKPISAYKGKTSNVPHFIEMNFSGTTCDKEAGFIQGGKPIIFLSGKGRMIKIIGRDSPYEDTLKLLERYKDSNKP